MQDILLLHGAIGASAQLLPLAALLQDSYRVHTFDLSGHGGKAFGNEAFSIDTFKAELLSFIDEKGLERPEIFGYSMGGYIALYLARHHPEKVGRIITLATKFHWDEATAAKEVKMLQPDVIEQKLPAFAQTLKERHAPNDWKDVLTRTAKMLQAMGNDNPLKPEDHTGIEHEILVMLGDRDKMVTLEETLQVYKALPKSQLAILPDTPHPIEQADPKMLRFFVERFFN